MLEQSHGGAGAEVSTCMLEQSHGGAGAVVSTCMLEHSHGGAGAYFMVCQLATHALGGGTGEPRRRYIRRRGERGQVEEQVEQPEAIRGD